MAAVKLLDFQDIYTAILEEIGEQTSNTNALNKVKRYINTIYVDEVAPFKNWKWLRKRTNIIHKAAHNDGTCAVTPGSATVTLSTAPGASLGSFTKYKFSVDGYPEIYDISSHTAESTTVTLTTEFQGTLATAATYKIWRDRIDLPTNCLRTFQIDHDHYVQQMKGVGYQELQKIMKDSPKLEGYPTYYHTSDFFDPDTDGDDETESNRYRQAIIYPAMHTTDNVTLHVDYAQEVTALDLDGDEPLMPIGDRVVLFYGGVSWAWRQIARNPEEAQRRWADFERKLERMAAEIEDGFDRPSIGVNSRYRNHLRRSRIGSRRQPLAGVSAPTSGSNPNITFASDITLQGSTLTDDMTVSSGVEIIFSDYTAGSVLFVGSTKEIQEDNSNFFWDDANNELQVANLGVTTAISLDAFTQGSVLFVGASGAVNEDNTNLFWDDTNNRLGIGVAASENTVTVAGTSTGSTLSVHAEGATDLAEMSVHRHSDTAGFGSHFIGVRSRGTEAAETVVQDGDTLLRLHALGHDGTDYNSAAQISVEVDGTPGDNDMPGRIIFSVTPDGSNTVSEALRISQDKSMTLRSATPTFNFIDTDAGDLDVGASISVAATDTGSGAEDVDISFNQQIAGVLTEVILLDADGDLESNKNITIQNSAPTIQFKDTDAIDSDINASIDVNLTDTGSGSEDADLSIKVQVAGTLTEVININGDSGITLSKSLYGANGSISNPGIGFLEGSAIGFWRAGNTIFMGVNGVQVFTASTQELQLNQQLRLQDTAQSTTVPGLIGASADDNTGISLPGSDAMHLISGGVQIAEVSGGNTFDFKITPTVNGSPISGGGSKNYLEGSDSDFESDTGSWTTFDDGSVSTPVDGTGGTASNISIARTTTSGEVSAGTGALEITKANTADSQGEGLSVDFSIDYGQQGKPQEVSFDLITGSGFVNSDWRVFIYDVTNATVLNVFTLDNNSGDLFTTSSTGNRFTGLWHAASDSQSYRLIIMCTDTDTTDYTFSIDDVRVGPISSVQAFNSGPVTAFTPSWTNFTLGNGTEAWYYKRVGSALRIWGEVTLGSTSSVGAGVSMAFPGGYTPDDSVARLPGAYLYDISGGGSEDGYLLISSTSIAIQDTGGRSSISSTVPFTWATGDKFGFSVEVEIDGANVSDVMSTMQADLRSLQVLADLSTASHTSSGSYQNVSWTESKDTHNSFDGTTFTAPYTGTFIFGANLSYAANATGVRGLKLNASTGNDPQGDLVPTAGGAISTSVSSSLVALNLTKGDTVDIQGYQNSGGTLNYNTTQSKLSILGFPDFSVFGVKGVYEVVSADNSGSYDNYTITAGTFGDLTSITLSPGTWAISGQALFYANGAVTTTEIHLGIDTTSGTSHTNSTPGVNSLVVRHPQTSGSTECITVNDWIQTITSETIYYLKARALNSITNLQTAYSIKAVRLK